jgi:hypothetical protein
MDIMYLGIIRKFSAQTSPGRESKRVPPEYNSNLHSGASGGVVG